MKVAVWRLRPVPCLKDQRVSLSRFIGEKEVVQSAEIKGYCEIAGYAASRLSRRFLDSLLADWRYSGGNRKIH